MPPFDSLEDFEKALNRYREDDDYSYRNVCEDHGISSKGIVSKWFSPIIKGESNSEEVWEGKTTGRGRGKKRNPEEEDKDEEVEGGNRRGKVILIVIIILVIIGIILMSA